MKKLYDTHVAEKRSLRYCDQVVATSGSIAW